MNFNENEKNTIPRNDCRRILKENVVKSTLVLTVSRCRCCNNQQAEAEDEDEGEDEEEEEIEYCEASNKEQREKNELLHSMANVCANPN